MCDSCINLGLSSSSYHKNWFQIYIKESWIQPTVTSKLPKHFMIRILAFIIVHVLMMSPRFCSTAQCIPEVYTEKDYTWLLSFYFFLVDTVTHICFEFGSKMKGCECIERCIVNQNDSSSHFIIIIILLRIS